MQKCHWHNAAINSWCINHGYLHLWHHGICKQPLYLRLYHTDKELLQSSHLLYLH
jgi:hypothetical protein